MGPLLAGAEFGLLMQRLAHMAVQDARALRRPGGVEEALESGDSSQPRDLASAVQLLQVTAVDGMQLGSAALTAVLCI